MIVVDIPGRGTVKAENAVFDYNGTLAVDGVMSKNTRDGIAKIKNFLNVYILTADTYGTVYKECSDLGVHVKTFPQENAGLCKKDIVKQLGAEKTICVGNGFNDIEMCKEAVLSIAVAEKEGCCGKLLLHSDIVVKSIEDVFDILLRPERIKATLRN